jgi:hypothetical protein
VLAFIAAVRDVPPVIVSGLGSHVAGKEPVRPPPMTPDDSPTPSEPS